MLEVAHRFCAPDETGAIRGAIEVSEIAALTILWSAKEAVLKALGATACAAADLRLRRVRADGAHVVCDFDGHPAGPARAVAYRDSEFVYSVAAAAPSVRDARGRRESRA